MILKKQITICYMMSIVSVVARTAKRRMIVNMLIRSGDYRELTADWDCVRI